MAESEYIVRIFDAWLEQKIIREIYKDHIGSSNVWQYDREAVDLSVGDRFGNWHDLLQKSMAIEIMGWSQDAYIDNKDTSKAGYD